MSPFLFLSLFHSFYFSLSPTVLEASEIEIEAEIEKPTEWEGFVSYPSYTDLEAEVKN